MVSWTQDFYEILINKNGNLNPTIFSFKEVSLSTETTSGWSTVVVTPALQGITNTTFQRPGVAPNQDEKECLCQQAPRLPCNCWPYACETSRVRYVTSVKPYLRATRVQTSWSRNTYRVQRCQCRGAHTYVILRLTQVSQCFFFFFFCK